MIAAVLAGGVGARMGAPSPKQLLPLEGRPIIEHSIAAFEASPEVDEIVVLMVEEYVGRVEDIVAEAGFSKVSRVLPGGATRTDTSYAALSAMAGAADSDLALLHDAARPLVRAGTITACVAALGAAGAVGVAVPSADTVVRVAPGRTGGEVIAQTPDRSRLRRMQTPRASDWVWPGAPTNWRWPTPRWWPPTTAGWCCGTCPRRRCGSCRARRPTSR